MVCARRLRFKRGLLGGVMAWQGSVPAFPDGMTGQPIWSLHRRVRSERRTIGGSTSGKIRNGVEPCDGAPGEIRTHDLCLRRNQSVGLVADFAAFVFLKPCEQNEK